MKKLIYFIIGLVGLITYFFINKIFNIGIPCIFYELTNLYCPGCGVTRMFFSLLKLDVYQAFRYNPLVFTYLVMYIIYKIINLKIKIKIPSYFSYILLIIAIIFGILRNLEEFSYLKPTLI